jgi:hypothetical protein
MAYKVDPLNGYPRMPKRDFDLLVADIRQHGVREHSPAPEADSVRGLGQRPRIAQGEGRVHGSSVEHRTATTV